MSDVGLSLTAFIAFPKAKRVSRGEPVLWTCTPSTGRNLGGGGGGGGGGGRG